MIAIDATLIIRDRIYLLKISVELATTAIYYRHNFKSPLPTAETIVRTKVTNPTKYVCLKRQDCMKNAQVNCNAHRSYS
jgi:hypothetical protein